MKMTIRRTLALLLALVVSAGILPGTGFAAQTTPAYTHESWGDVDYHRNDGIALLATNFKPALTCENQEKWIDRLEALPGYAADFYAWMAENTDGDGTQDALIDVTTADVYQNQQYLHALKTLEGSTTYNASSSDASSAAQEAVDAAIADAVDQIRGYTYAVVDAFDRDHPQVFWLSGSAATITSCQYTYSSNGTVSYTATVYLVLKDSTYDVRSPEFADAAAIYSGITQRDQAVSAILAGTNPEMSQYEKVLYFNDWLTANNCYNSNSDLDNHPDADFSRCCLSALTGSTGTTGPVCEGYSRAMDVLCQAAGIPCVLVNGANHMWNYIKMDDGKWYATDVTWNDPTVSGVTSAVSGKERHDYFMVGGQTVIDGKTFLTDHPVENSASGNGVAFINGPKLSDSAWSSGTQPEPTQPETQPTEPETQPTQPPAAAISSNSGSASLAKLSKEEISKLLSNNPLTMPDEVFETAPSVTAPYAPGKVSAPALQAAVNRLNALRRLAGLPGVTLDQTLCEQAQYGAVIQAVLGGLSHTPGKPGDMDDAFYQMAYDASGSSNLSAGSTLTESVDAYMDDSDSSNIDRVGHRRWQLNPSLGKVGFGYATSNTMYRLYSAEKVFDHSGTTADYDFVSWPASGNFPNTQFGGHVAWSISLNPARFSKPVQSELTVTLTRQSDGKSWSFSGSNYQPASSSAFFTVENSGYGISNCIIFRPDGVTSYDGIYSVSVDGLKDLSGNAVQTLSFQVDFFTPTITAPETQPTQPETQPTEPETQPTQPETQPTDPVEPENKPSITGIWTTDVVMPASDLGVNTEDARLRCTLTFKDNGTVTTTWKAINLDAFREFYHELFVNAYLACAYGSGLTDYQQIEQFCMDSTGKNVSDYIYAFLDSFDIKKLFTPVPTSGTYTYNDAHTAIYTDLNIMGNESTPSVPNSFTISGNTLKLNAASYNKPDYTFVCTRKTSGNPSENEGEIDFVRPKNGA